MKLFLTLTILFSSNSLQASFCSQLFAPAFSPTSQYKTIDEFLIKSDVKDRLIEISKRDAGMANFVMQLLRMQDYYYYTNLAKMVRGEYRNIDYWSLGYAARAEIRELKYQAIMKQYLILSLIDPKDLTKKFQAIFYELNYRIFDPHTHKNELLSLLDKLDGFIQVYN